MEPSSTRTLGRTGLEVTCYGMGSAPMGDLWERLPEARVEATFAAAFDGGVRYFDTAPWYGNTLAEHRLGHFLRRRDDTFAVSTKVGRVYRRPKTPDEQPIGPWAGGLPFILRFDYGYDAVMRSYEDSLQRLGLPRVDLLVIHDIDIQYHGDDAGIERCFEQLDQGGGIRALEELKASGDIKGFGAGINEGPMITRFLDRFDLDFFLVAMPYTLVDQAPLDDAFPRCAAKNVGIIIGSPYASGILATGPVEGAKYNYSPASAEVLAKVRGIQDVCRRYDVPLQAAALQFPLGHPSVAAIIPGAVRAEEVEQNLSYFRKEIPADCWAELKAEGLLREDAPVPG
ncbi:MAG: aldo/keto reductase [Alphaproteobacteria bacterium]